MRSDYLGLSQDEQYVWKSLLSTISISSNYKLSGFLNLPIEVSVELEQFAHDALLYRLSLFEGHNELGQFYKRLIDGGETLSLDIFKDIQPNQSFEDKYEKFWQIVFWYLKRFNHFESLLQWVTISVPEQNHSILRQSTYLVHRWAVETWLKNKKTRQTNNDHQSIVVAAAIEEKSYNPFLSVINDISDLPFDENLKQTIQNINFEYDYFLHQFYKTRDVIFQSVLTLWEQTALTLCGRPFLNRSANFQIGLNKIQAIINTIANYAAKW